MSLPTTTLPRSESNPIRPGDSIHKAAEKGDVEVVAALLKKKKSLLNAEDENGYTPIHLASLYNCYDMVRFLIDAGCDLNKPDKFGWSALHFAASGRNENLFKLLLRQDSISGTS